MNQNIFTSLAVIALALSIASAQLVRGNRRGGVQRGAQAGAASQSSLKASDRNSDAQQAKLQSKQAKKERLDRRAARRERKRAKAARAEGERLAAANSVDYETVESAAEFSNLDAAVEKEASNKFALQLAVDNKHKESAAVKESSGSKFNQGTKFSSDSFLDTEVFDRAEVLSEGELFDGEELSTANAEENLLNAQEAVQVESEATIDARNAEKVQGSGQRSGFFGDDVFGGSGFGSFVFKRR